MSEPTLPTPPTSTPLPPERVQFTMRTFFVAAVWISVGFGVHHGALSLITDSHSRFHDNVTVLWWSLWLWISLWALLGTLRSHAARIAMVLGFVVMGTSFLATCLIAYLTSRGHVRFEDFTFGVPITSLMWSIFLGLFVGISRSFAGMGKWAIHKASQRWLGRRSAGNDPIRRRTLSTARLVATAYVVVSLAMLLLALAALRISPRSSMTWQSAVGPCFQTGRILLDMPVFCPLEELDLAPKSVRKIYSSHSGKEFFNATLFFGILGLPLYFLLGWLIGWRLDRRETRRLAEWAKVNQQSASMSAEDLVEAKPPEGDTAS